ncbi:hypothetical protein GQ600_24175 [Phytophthora cactorum]|nr:hypothetical protein GQ600_24175 [Phytophthora cactorum]
MDTQLPVFSGTLKVHACHLFWTKTPVQLTYHRQDYRHALPVLLIRRPGILGGEFRVPLDPCIHPRMASKLEFALEYGWHTKQVRLRAPDAHTYRQWTSLVRAALESGRRPLASCDYTTSAEQPRPDLECSSLASTMDSSSNGTSRFNATIRQRVIEDEQDSNCTLSMILDAVGMRPVSSSCCIKPTTSQVQAAVIKTTTSSLSAALQPLEAAAEALLASLRGYIDFHIDWPAITHELYLQASVFYFLL